jgi:hypothetical protein
MHSDLAPEDSSISAAEAEAVNRLWHLLMDLDMLQEELSVPVASLEPVKQESLPELLSESLPPNLLLPAPQDIGCEERTILDSSITQTDWDETPLEQLQALLVKPKLFNLEQFQQQIAHQLELIQYQLSDPEQFSELMLPSTITLLQQQFIQSEEIKSFKNE